MNVAPTLSCHPRARTALAVARSIAILAASLSLFSAPAAEAAPNPNPTWNVDDPILFRTKAEPFDHFAVKDPTIVFTGGKYHMFYTGANASGGWQMLYSSATTLEGFRTAPHTFLTHISESYFAAPEVFFFEPQGLWYLIYQDGAFGAAYATTTNIADPGSWSGPHSLGISGNLGWDYYVICDTASCYMYNSPSDGSRRIFLRKTALGSFPNGWSAPTVVLSDTFEGVNVYRSIADGQYYLVVEDLLDNRYYELWTSGSAGGPWNKVSEKWAWHGNLVFNGASWTNNVSHGDILRAGINQRLEISDINHVDFLIQGTTQLSCCPYQQIPWDLGIIRNYPRTTGGNLLANGDIEAGTTGWSVFGAGSLSASTSTSHGGSRSLSITGRTAAWNGPAQVVTTKLTNGKSYTTSVWVRAQSGAPAAKATLALTTGGTTSFVQLAPATTVNSSGWTQLSGTATVSWTGTLSSATLYIETTAGTDALFIDDASFQ